MVTVVTALPLPGSTSRTVPGTMGSLPASSFPITWIVTGLSWLVLTSSSLATGPNTPGTSMSVSSLGVPPSGSLASTFATLITVPSSTSATVMVYFNSNDWLAFGANVAISSFHSGNNMSVTTISDNVTLPVLVTVMVYVMTSPTLLNDTRSATFVISIPTSLPTGTSISSSSSGSPGFSPVALATFTTPQTSMSDCVTVHSSSKLREAVGAMSSFLALLTGTLASVPVRRASDLLPVLVPVMVYVITSPAALNVARSAPFVISIPVSLPPGTSISSSSSGSPGFSPVALAT